MAVLTKNINYLLIVALFTLLNLPYGVICQDDSTKNEFLKEFNDFRDSAQDRFNAFVSENDSLFYQFLLENWKEFRLMTDERKTVPKPKDQPKIDSGASINTREIKPLIKKSKPLQPDTGGNVLIKKSPPAYHAVKYEPGFPTISFYGSEIKVQAINVSPVERQGVVTQKLIADFYKDNATNPEMLDAIGFLKEQATAKQYNTWGFLRLLQEYSSTYFANVNDRVLFTWFALVKTGYDAKVGYDNHDIYLLVNFDVPVYYIPYFINENEKYYLIAFKGQPAVQDKIVSFQAAYPEQSKSVSLVLKQNPLFEPKTGTRIIHYQDRDIKISYNLNMVDFYSTYPDCDLSVYFPPSLSKLAFKSFDDYFNPIIKNKTAGERIGLLLEFIQNAFPYSTDDQQFGREKYLFAEETLSKPFSDCEDRSILLAQLIQHFSKTDVIGLVYPNHVLLAVAFPDVINGCYLTVDNTRFYVCDPTYIGSEIGMLMPEYENVRPDIIKF